MPARRGKVFGAVFGAALALCGCAAVAPGLADLPVLGTELATPPPASGAAAEAAMRRFAEGRFSYERGRWFAADAAMPLVAAMHRTDDALRGTARRVIETEPDGAPARVRLWRFDRGADGVALVAARAGGEPQHYAYVRVRFQPAWQPALADPAKPY